MSKIDRIKDIIRKRLKEESATGTGASFNSGNSGENYAPVAGEAPNYYVKKLGYKLVNRKKLNKAAKGIEVKQLEEEQTTFDLESYISTLPTDDEKLKKYIAGHMGDYNTISSKLKELIQLVGDAKKDDINTYRKDPQFRSAYSTDLAIDHLNDLIDFFTK
jgi:hypothetical protein